MRVLVVVLVVLVFSVAVCNAETDAEVTKLLEDLVVSSK